MRGWHDLLLNIPISTGTVLEDILARARNMQLMVAPMFSVDQACDLVGFELLLPIADYTLHGWNVEVAGVVRLRQCFSPPGPRWVPGVAGGAGRLQSDYGADQ